MQSDPALASRPETFELVPGGPVARIFRIIAVVDLVVFGGLGVSFLVSDDADPLLGWVLIAAGPVACATMLWLAAQQSTWRMRDGRPLAVRAAGVREAAAEDAYARLASADPTALAGIELVPLRGARAQLRGYSPADEQVTYAVVVRGASGPNRDASPIVELRGAQHDAFQRAIATAFATPRA